MAIHGLNPYPVSALGAAIAAAAAEVSMNKRVSQDLTGLAAFTCAAAAVQDGHNVKRPDMAASPITVLTIVSADSGAGKSTAAKLFIAAHEHVQSQMDHTNEDHCGFKAEHICWETELMCLRGELRKCMERKSDLSAAGAITTQSTPDKPDGVIETEMASEPDEAQDVVAEGVDAPGDADAGPLVPAAEQVAITSVTADELRERIRAHLLREPKKPKQTKLLYDHVTPTAVRRHLPNWPSALIASLDADHVLNGRLGSDFDLLNSLWDGDTQRSDTTEERTVAYDPRVSALLFTQPGPMLRYWQRRGEAAKDTGLFARSDWALVPSPFDDGLGDEVVQTDVAVKAYQARVTDLLLQRIRERKSGRIDRRVVPFTADGASYFRDLYRRTMQMKMLGGEWALFPGYASKMAERIARYACIIHTFNDLPGDINSETLASAEQIADWHARQFKQLTLMTSPETQAMHSSYALETRLRQAVQRGEAVRYADLARICPPDWKRPQLNGAWQALVNTGRASLRIFRKTQYIHLPGMYSPLTWLDTAHLRVAELPRSNRAVANLGNGFSGGI